ncbi:hypothetical protein TKK_0009602 [Trichogramma kaykai]|uniref:Uncharacterized protein n=1 Tax=Trichogramma kaykai TaxID=54128 RepID=A0ABD2WZT0_9HYME
MGKIVIVLCIIAMIAGVTIAQDAEAILCRPGGTICRSDADCCVGLVCNLWAGRCTAPKLPPPVPEEEEVSGEV